MDIIIARKTMRGRGYGTYHGASMSVSVATLASSGRYAPAAFTSVVAHVPALIEKCPVT